MDRTPLGGLIGISLLMLLLALAVGSMGCGLRLQSGSSTQRPPSSHYYQYGSIVVDQYGNQTHTSNMRSYEFRNYGGGNRSIQDANGQWRPVY